MDLIEEFLDDVLTDWAYRVHDGMPNPKNSKHLKELHLTLMDYDIPDDIIYEVIQNLVINEDGGLSDKEKEKAKKMNLVHLGKGAYGKEGGEASHQAVDGKLVAKGDKEEPEKETKPPMKIDANPFDDKENKDSKGKNISDKSQKIVGDFDTRITKNNEFLSGDKKQLVKKVSEKIKVLYDEDATSEQQKEAAQWVVDNAGFSANEIPSTGKRKAYLNKLGGDRKILGNGTTNTENLVKKVESLVGKLKTFDSKGTKQGFTTAAKPDLGNENIVKPKDDERVAEYFSNHPILQKIRGGLHGIFGVKGDDGNIKMPSSEHSKDYLSQSFNNPALQNTIDFAKKQTQEGNVDEKVVTSLESHQNNLKNILKSYEIPSEEAQQAIADSYNDLMVGLHKSDSDIANSIMKQIAENNLYEQELAAGEEVYLPSAGNFPAGDKIKGGTTERVALVSCKFGKAGRIYGCPANSKTICELHPDESKQNNQGQYLGEKGHTLVINDNLIKGKSKVETKEKTKGFIEKTLKEVNLGDTFSDEETTEIANITADYMEEIDNIKKELSSIDFPNEGSKWKEFSKRVKVIESDYKKRMGKVVTKEHAATLIGENNAGNLVQTGGVKVEALMSTIEIANNIRTNTSLNELEHNKQYYDENGKPKFVTDKGNQNPDDYSITFRTKRTPGRTGGGCQLSFTGDGKTPNTSLNKDGSVTDSQTGEEIEA